jgi:hypothetical protein
MLANTTILAFLAKALKGNANQQPGDTKIVVPGLFQNVISVPEIQTFFDSAPNNTVHVKSFLHADARVFNLTGTTLLTNLGPGLWEVEYSHWITPLGAVNDLTSNVGLQCTLAEGVGSTVNLTRFTNTGLVFQSMRGLLRMTVPSEQNISFFVDTIIGAGTGTNASRILLNARRLL